LVFAELAAQSPLPLISIVDVCAAAAHGQALRRLALLGTRFTMEAPFYETTCARYGIMVLSPDATARAWVHRCYTEELLKGEFREETRERFVALIEKLRLESGIDGVILGGTELPLLLRSPTIAGVPVLDTTALHVEAIVARLRLTGNSSGGGATQ
jgi:aspartate racemase